MTYPKWLYNATKKARIVEHAEEHAALGPDWAETPAAFLAAPPVPPPGGESDLRNMYRTGEVQSVHFSDLFPESAGEYADRLAAAEEKLDAIRAHIPFDAPKDLPFPAPPPPPTPAKRRHTKK